MIKVGFYKVKLNGLLSGEGCYQGGSISTAYALGCRCCEVCMVKIVPKLYLTVIKIIKISYLRYVLSEYGGNRTVSYRVVSHCS